MKRYLYIIIIPLLLLTISCNREQDYASAKFEYVGFASSRLPSSVPEGTGETISEIEVPVRYGNWVSPERELPVTIEIDPASTAVLGKDFLLEGTSATSESTFEVIIPKDASSKSFVIKTISNFDKEEDRQLKLNIVGTPEGVNIGYPLDATYVVNILDDDCEFIADDFIGESDATELYPGDPYGPYTSTFVYNGDNSYTITNFLDAGGEVTITVNPDPTALTVEVPFQDFDYVGYDATAEGSGRLNTCGKSMTLSIILDIPGLGHDEFDVEYVF